MTKSKTKAMASDGGGGAVYGLGFLGSLIYFIRAADTFWEGLFGILQAILWPAYVVFKLLESFYG